MAEKMVHSHYKINDVEFELWTETSLREPNWWLTFGGVKQDDDQFTPKQIQAVSDYVADWRAPGGRV